MRSPPLIPASAVIPSLLLMWYFHARDLFREPAKVLWATFGLGVLMFGFGLRLLNRSYR